MTAIPSMPVAPVPPPGPRVELGFRDGTSSVLDPTSADAQALDQLARSLVRGR